MNAKGTTPTHPQAPARVLLVFFLRRSRIEPADLIVGDQYLNSPFDLFG